MVAGDHPDWQEPPAAYPSEYLEGTSVLSLVGGNTTDTLIVVGPAERFRVMAARLQVAYALQAAGAGAGLSLFNANIFGGTGVLTIQLPVRHLIDSVHRDSEDSGFIVFEGPGLILVTGSDPRVSLDHTTESGTAPALIRLRASYVLMGVVEPA
jgi:hypothetical protein